MTVIIQTSVLNNIKPQLKHQRDFFTSKSTFAPDSSRKACNNINSCKYFENHDYKDQYLNPEQLNFSNSESFAPNQYVVLYSS